MDPKAKKELEEQGTSVVQAVKWIGGAIFGDADHVLDEMAEHGDAEDPPPPPRRRMRPRHRRSPPTLPARIIDIEDFVDDEDDK